MLLVQGTYQKIHHYCNDIFKTNYYEFCFSYVENNERFREIDRFIWESKHFHTRFKNRYTGQVVVDLTAWSNKEPNEYYEAFLYFLKDYEPHCELCFITSEQYQEPTYAMLKKMFNVKTVDLGIENVKVERTIGFSISKEGKENV